MRIRKAILVLAALSAACQRSSDPSTESAARARSDKLIRAAEPISGQYLVALEDGLGEADAQALVARHGGTLLAYLPPPVNAVSLRLAPDRALALAADPAVRIVEEDARVRAASLPWNLDRIDQRVLPSSGGYAAATTGAGVHVYVIDTGVLLAHPELAPRADAPASFADGPEGGDCNGHGTHVAAIVAGTAVGVARGATVHSVRALDCEGVGAMSSLVRALDWVRENHESPAVALVGLTAGLSPMLDEAIRELVKAGVTLVAPAGNDPLDACGRLPAAVPEVLTAGATTNEDAVVDPSSQGRCVDLFAPGSEIRSAWNDGSSRFESGTSQAAAHVAGAAALFLDARPGADPVTVANALVGNATLGVVVGVTADTPNRLLYVGFIEPTFADTTALMVAIVDPEGGVTVTGSVTVSVTADAGASQVAVFVDGEYLGADATGGDGFGVPWPTERFGNGPHLVTARAYDAAGNAGEHEITAFVRNPGAAEYDDEIEVPACAAPGPRCASGALLAGRGPVGPEANAPNTVRSACADGVGGRYRQDESIEAIEVRTALAGQDLAEGQWVDVEVTVWGYPDHAADRVDLWFANDAGAPAWQYLGTSEIPGAGAQKVRFSYRLPAFPETPARLQQAVRATIRYGGSPAECTDGPYDDHDDLAFAVEKGDPDTLKPTVAITSPNRGATVSGAAVPLVATATDNGGGAITRVEFLVDDALVGMQPEGASGSYTVAWNADAARLGTHLLRAVAYDTSGNFEPSDAVSVTVVDWTAPAVTIVRPDPGAVVGGRVHVEADASDNRAVTAVEFRANGQVIGTAVSPPWAIEWVTTVASGQATLTATARDASKNSKTSTPVTVTLDNVAPMASIVSPEALSSVSGREVTVTVEASDTNGPDGISQVDVYAAGAYVDTATRGAGAQWSVSWNSATLENGLVELTARVYDLARNAFTTEPIVVRVADVAPPVVVVTDPPSGNIVRRTIDIAVTATDDGVVKEVAFLANGTPIGVDAFPPYVVPWDTTDFADGLTTIVARAKDQAGNLGDGTRTVVIDNSGPSVEIEEPAAGDIHGTVLVKIRADDASGVDQVDVYADALYLGSVVDTLYLGTATPVPLDPGAYALSWPTTAVDNRTFRLKAVANDTVDNVTTSDPVTVRVDNVTTAEFDAALGAPACKWSAAWCFSGTLLDGAGPVELNAPNTLGGACADGASSAYHATESVDSIRIQSQYGFLASGRKAFVTIRYWAYAGNEADQVDVYHAADADDPSWVHLRTLTPVAAGLNEQVVAFTLPTGPLQVIRANFRFAQPGPSTCSERVLAPDDPPPEDDFGDRDDLVFAVDSPADTAAPTVTLDAPADGGVVSGDVRIRATARDDQGIARVEYWIDGTLAETLVEPLWAWSFWGWSLLPRYEAVWPSQLGADGPHELQVKAYDTSGNMTSTEPVTVTVYNVANAVFDDALGVPACSTVESFCDPGMLLDGRGHLPPSPEPNAPNTLLASCADGDEGVYHEDESLDWIKVSSVDGLPLAAGKRARVEARVWAYTGWSDDALDLFYATSPGQPHWIWFATVKPGGPGLQTLVAEYVLPPSGWQAVRGRFRYGGSVQPCGDGIYDDHDDIVFAAEYTPNASYDAALKVPACSGAAAYCDSGALLDGRGLLGPEPNAPNTLGATCADGTYGAYHVEPSVDGIVVATDDGSTLRAGKTARVEIRVFASASWEGERVDLFTSASPGSASPTWQHLTTLRPSRQGSQVLFAGVTPGAAGAHAIRAHLLRPVWWFEDAAACGTEQSVNVIDDQDDLVFEVAP
jgi:subtilisin family serine protease